MSGHSMYQVQEAVYEVLNGDSTLGALITGVYDFVPEGTAFPYVTLGNNTAIDYDTKTVQGQEITMVVGIWSQSEDRIPLIKIGQRIHELLHRQTFTVTGKNLINSWCEFEEPVRDPDGHTMHHIMRFRIIVTDY